MTAGLIGKNNSEVLSFINQQLGEDDICDVVISNPSNKSSAFDPLDCLADQINDVLDFINKTKWDVLDYARKKLHCQAPRKS